MSKYSYLYKYIIIGDTSVGKSCVLLQFLQNKFKFDHDTTIGVQFGTKLIELDGKPIKLQIWDTAGQQAFQSITRSYYRGSIGVILVYDVTSKTSFNNLHKWVQETRTYSNDKISMILVGNKADLQQKRSVLYKQGQQFANKNGMMFKQCSAKTGQNVDSLFFELSQTVNKKIVAKQIDPANQSMGVKLGSYIAQDKQVENKQKQSCC